MQMQTPSWSLTSLPLYDRSDDPGSGKYKGLARVRRDRYAPITRLIGSMSCCLGGMLRLAELARISYAHQVDAWLSVEPCHAPVSERTSEADTQWRKMIERTYKRKNS
jgi:hypothetical protein